MKAPALFIGHGSPLNAIANNNVTSGWRQLGDALRKSGHIRAALVISAHWMLPEHAVCSAKRPETIYDFYGFPEELYQIEYPCAGDAELAGRIATLLSVSATAEWGLDHGAWSVLRWLFPEADVPCLQLAMDGRAGLRELLEIGALLRPLRQEGVMILGSGNIVHNLGAADFSGRRPPYPWTVSFDESVGRLIQEGDYGAVAGAIEDLPDGRLAHPSDEHFRPLLYVLGAAESDDRLSFPVVEYQNASISMRAALFSSRSESLPDWPEDSPSADGD